MTPSDFAALQEGHTELKAQVAEMRVELAKNSEITGEIREVMVAARTGFKVLGWLGQALKWGGALAAGIAGFFTLWHQVHK